MDCLRVRCAKVFYDYRANLINYEEFKRRLKVIDDEIKTKQLALDLQAIYDEQKEVTP